MDWRSSTSPQSPPICQAPKAISLTFQPVLPKSRYRMRRSAPRHLLLLGASQEALVHRVGGGVGPIMEGAKPLIQSHRTIGAVVAFKILVVEEVEVIVGLDLDAVFQDDAFEPRMALGGRDTGVLQME